MRIRGALWREVRDETRAAIRGRAKFQHTAVFAHDPAKGPETWQRMSVHKLPALPTKAIGGASAWQMGEDLKMLADLARTPFVVPGASGERGAPAIGADDAVDRLAGWLLDSSGIPRDA